MPTYANDPVRVNITKEDIMAIGRTKKGPQFVKPGICLNWEIDPHNKDIYFLQCSGVSNHPNNPKYEIQKEHINKQLEILGKYIVQDKMRERYPFKIMPKDPTIKLQQRIVEKNFKENRYDLMIDKATEKHKLYYPREKRIDTFATLEGGQVNNVR